MLMNHLKIAIRNLHRYRAYTVINVMGLALSMCCGILIFTLVKFHLGFDDFHYNQDRIYRIVTEEHRDNISYTPGVPSPLGKAFRNDYTFAEKVARILTVDEPLITIQEGNENRKFKEKDGVAFAEPEFFDIFNFPLLGGNKNSILSEPNTAVITENLAKRYFGQTDPINKTIKINNQILFKITGVLKDFPPNTDRRTGIYVAYASLKQYNDWLASDDSWGGISDDLQCFTRLRPNVSKEAVEKALFTYVKKYRPNSKNVHHYKLQPLPDIHFDTRYGASLDKNVLWVFSFIGLFLIITACVNFINLATAQALKRSKEVGIRKVLGSFRTQIFWQFMSETGVITLLAMVLSVGLSFFFLPYLNEWFNIQMSINLISDWHISLFIILLVLAVTFLAGFYPGLIMSGYRPIQAIKGNISRPTHGAFNTRRTLIVTQFVISQVLIIGMIVIAGQMHYVKDSDLGFDKEALVMLPMMDPKIAAMNTLRDQLGKIRGVEKISICSTSPSSQDNWTSIFKYDNRLEDENFGISVKASDEKYVSTFGLKLLAGRNIFHSDSLKEFLVNETFVKKLNLKSPGEVIGKRLSINGGTLAAPIVGVINDFHDQSFHENINAVCIGSISSNYAYYAVKINMSNFRSTLGAMEKTWVAMNPDQLYEYHFLDEQIGRFYETEDLMLRLIEIFTLIAIFIGCLGLYGLVSFMASQKIKEIGIRKVLGGTLINILWIFGREFSLLIGIALVIAAPLGWSLMNAWLQNFKFRIPISPWVFGITILASAIIVLLAAGFQAVKASIRNPVDSLRSE